MIPICRDPKRFVAALNKFRNFTSPSRKFDKFLLKSSVSGISFVPRRNFGTSSIASQSAIQGDGHAPHIAVNSVVATDRSLELNLIGPRSSNWWTGKAPIPGLCPGVAPNGVIHSLPQLSWGNGSLTRESLHAYFDNTWTITEVLFSALQTEEAFTRPPYHDLRHPMIFYYGHPAVLYINKLRVAGLLKNPINPYFESIFETGVDEMSWDDLSKNKMPWPSVQEVHTYRKTVYGIVSNLIKNVITDQQLREMNQNSPLWALVMGFEHERIHIETSSFLMNELPLSFLRRPEHFPSYHPSVSILDTAQKLKEHEETLQEPKAGVDYPVNDLLPVPAQTVTIGKNRDFPSFGWDNEYGRREFNLPAFKASKFKISNGEFLEFVRDNGYARNELWSEAGWQWRAFRNVKWPTFWNRVGPQGHHKYHLRLLFDTAAMPWDWPVVVNYHEAAAFAKWKSLKTGKKYRLLCETEHRAIRDSNAQTETVRGDHAAILGGEEAFVKGGMNVNLAYGSMSPVNALPANSKGFCDVFGNAWEWTEDFFCALPGFQIHPLYEDFSTPCFDGLHHVIQGGSFISTGNEASVHARFHFRPHFYQHASFRLVEQLEENDEDGFFTSDRDAPGPFVGQYPFRRSQKQQMLQMQRDKEKQDTLQLRHTLSKHFIGLCRQDPLASPAVSLADELVSRYNMTTLAESVAKHLAEVCPGGATQLRDNGRLLEVGCVVGGLTFPLSRHMHTTIAVDHSQKHLDIAKQLFKEKHGRFALSGEGDETVSYNFDLATAVQGSEQKVEFRCADPMCLPAEMKDFDVVLLNDVLATVSAPNAILGRLGGVRGLVKEKGGVLCVLDTFDWNEERTPRSLWLGGTVGRDATVSRSADTLKEKLAADGFELKVETAVDVFWKNDVKNFNGVRQKLLIFRRI